MKYILCVLALHSCLSALAQPKQEKQVKVLLLGTFHFNNPGLDVAKFEGANILSPKRQREVEEIVRQLKRFSPDKIFIEAAPGRQAHIDSLLALYKAGQKELGESETEQIGFRLANQLGLSTLYCIDYQEADFPFDSLMKSAMEAGQTDITAFVQNTIEEVQRTFNDALKTSTIKEMLLRENSAALMRLQHEFYFKLIPAGKPGNHVGSYLVSEWWRRNIVIYENMLKRLDGNEERILVIFGSGHTAILDELMKFNTSINLVPVSEVLTTSEQ